MRVRLHTLLPLLLAALATGYAQQAHGSGSTCVANRMGYFATDEAALRYLIDSDAAYAFFVETRAGQELVREVIGTRASALSDTADQIARDAYRKLQAALLDPSHPARSALRFREIATELRQLETIARADRAGKAPLTRGELRSRLADLTRDLSLRRFIAQSDDTSVPPAAPPVAVTPADPAKSPPSEPLVATTDLPMDPEQGKITEGAKSVIDLLSIDPPQATAAKLAKSFFTETRQGLVMIGSTLDIPELKSPRVENGAIAADAIDTANESYVEFINKLIEKPEVWEQLPGFLKFFDDIATGVDASPIDRGMLRKAEGRSTWIANKTGKFTETDFGPVMLRVLGGQAGGSPAESAPRIYPDLPAIIGESPFDVMKSKRVTIPKAESREYAPYIRSLHRFLLSRLSLSFSFIRRVVLKPKLIERALHLTKDRVYRADSKLDELTLIQSARHVLYRSGEYYWHKNVIMMVLDAHPASDMDYYIDHPALRSLFDHFMTDNWTLDRFWKEWDSAIVSDSAFAELSPLLKKLVEAQAHAVLEVRKWGGTFDDKGKLVKGNGQVQSAVDQWEQARNTLRTVKRKIAAAQKSLSGHDRRVELGKLASQLKEAEIGVRVSYKRMAAAYITFNEKFEILQLYYGLPNGKLGSTETAPHFRVPFIINEPQFLAWMALRKDMMVRVPNRFVLNESKLFAKGYMNFLTQWMRDVVAVTDRLTVGRLAKDTAQKYAIDRFKTSTATMIVRTMLQAMAAGYAADAGKRAVSHLNADDIAALEDEVAKYIEATWADLHKILLTDKDKDVDPTQTKEPDDSQPAVPDESPTPTPTPETDTDTEDQKPKQKPVVSPPDDLPIDELTSGHG